MSSLIKWYEFGILDFQSHVSTDISKCLYETTLVSIVVLLYTGFKHGRAFFIVVICNGFLALGKQWTTVHIMFVQCN